MVKLNIIVYYPMSTNLMLEPNINLPDEARGVARNVTKRKNTITKAEVSLNFNHS